MRSSSKLFTDLTKSLQATNEIIKKVFLKYTLDRHCCQSKYQKVDITVFLAQHNVLVSVAGSPTFQDISTLQSGMWLQPTEIRMYLLQFT